MEKESKNSKKEEGVTTITPEQLNNLLNEIKDLKEQNRMLFEIADKKALGNWMTKHQKKLPNIIHIRELNGKVVVGWRVIEDYIGKNPLTGIWQEKQMIEIIFEDGSKKEMFMREFERIKLQVKCKRTGQIVDDQTEEVAFKLTRLDNGKEYTISSQFVN